jgi:histidine triad (HIT) family protein
VYEDAQILAFRDLNPEAPEHILVIPKKHIESLSQATEEDQALLGYMQLKIAEIAQELGLKEDGYRVVANTGRNGGQTVFHLHYHILGGRSMHWPPG